VNKRSDTPFFTAPDITTMSRNHKTQWHQCPSSANRVATNTSRTSRQDRTNRQLTESRRERRQTKNRQNCAAEIIQIASKLSVDTCAELTRTKRPLATTPTSEEQRDFWEACIYTQLAISGFGRVGEGRGRGNLFLRDTCKSLKKTIP